MDLRRLRGVRGRGALAGAGGLRSAFGPAGGNSGKSPCRRGDAATARENRAPENRPSEREDDQSWSAYRAVTLSGGPEVTANGSTGTVVVTVELTPQDDADPVTEDYLLTVVERDDRLLVIGFGEA